MSNGLSTKFGKNLTSLRQKTPLTDEQLFDEIIKKWYEAFLSLIPINTIKRRIYNESIYFSNNNK